MANNWEERADELLAELLSHSDSPIFHTLLEWTIAMYETEKEKLVIDNLDSLPQRYARIRALRDIRDVLSDGCVVD